MLRQDVYVHLLQGKAFFPYSQCRFALPATYHPERYSHLVAFATKFSQKEGTGETVETIDGVARYGTLLRIQRLDPVKAPPAEKTREPQVGYLGLNFARFKIITLAGQEGALTASIEISADEISKELEDYIKKKDLFAKLKQELKLYFECGLRGAEAQLKKERLDGETSIHKIVYQAVSDLDLPIERKLSFLQLDSLEEKIQLLIRILRERTEKFKGVVSIEGRVKEAMGIGKKSATSFFQNTLNSTNVKNEMEARIKGKKLPETVKAVIEKEMKNMGFGTDRMVGDKYIETLLEIPWMESSEEARDLQQAERILQEDHTGLREVKERILEHLAVKFRNGNSRGNVICLHGPPGVGKTSIAKSVARALGRSFTRISLGGLSDEAELRGHRRTYVAALPGAIVRALVKAKSNNPVILLDEIEKLGKGRRGDPEHALLQILDPSQNSSFVDHYVALPVDLSRVMFICTANSLELSGPLLNRLETIEVPGYSREQKAEIAKQHLIPQQLRENGVQGLVEFGDGSIEQLIKHSSELGVRSLERDIAKVCRMIARTGRRELVSRERVDELLGKRKRSELWSGVGVVNGMAYTESGGRVLMVEALQFRCGPQQVKVTGQLGEVMRESVDIAISWMRSNFQELGLQGHAVSKGLDQPSIHLHFPDGATKKDGPSAGITIVTCLASLLLKSPPRDSLAMTGEITLSGKVLAVGGVREKCMAAIYEGVKHIIVPEANLKDLERIDHELRKQAVFYGVKEIKEVLTIAFPTLLDKPAPKL